MLPESFYQIPNHESIIQITTSGLTGTHIKTLWSIFIFIIDDNKVVIPFEDFSDAEKDLKFNKSIKLTIRNADVENERNNNLPGIGYLISGDGLFIDKGPIFDQVREKYPRAINALIVTVNQCKQML